MDFLVFLTIIVTAQPHLNHNPTPTQQKVGWDTVITKKPPHPPKKAQNNHKIKKSNTKSTSIKLNFNQPELNMAVTPKQPNLVQVCYQTHEILRICHYFGRRKICDLKLPPTQPLVHWSLFLSGNNSSISCNVGQSVFMPALSSKKMLCCY